MEENEWSFCGMWTEQLKVGCAKGLINNAFQDEYFFNRASLHDCQNSSSAVEIAARFWQKGVDCYLHDRDGRLAGKGFAKIDTMYVLRATSKRNSTKTRVEQIDRSLLPVWIEVFCRSFAVPEWRTEVERIMNTNFRKVQLLLSYKDNVPAGCAALYSESGVTGLYCLGTISRLRRRGVAKDILQRAMSENLFLQTLGSEGLLPFYRKAGFIVAYTKKIYALLRP